MLAAYEQVCPGAADRILRLAEAQATHRHGLESHALHSNTRDARLGQILGFVLALVGLGGGLYLLAHDKSTAGYTSLLSTLGTLAAVFIYGRHQQSKERDAKRQQAER